MNTTSATATVTYSSLENWLEVIRDHKMPIFEQTVHRILLIAEDERAPASALANIILQDAALTARLLRLANSVLYNPSTTTISTVTRAVIVLGFNVVRELCLTLVLVETLLHGQAKVRLERELAHALHAATQARALAMASGDRSPEEVFIATLLYRIGELAFWCFGNEYCDRVEQLMQTGQTPEIAQEKILGFQLSALTRRLIHEWRLTDLLQEAIDHPTRQDDRLQTLRLGQHIAHCATEFGWESDEMTHWVQRSAELLDITEAEARELLQRKATEAATMARECGASGAAKRIPLPGEEHCCVDSVFTDPSVTNNQSTIADDAIAAAPLVAIEAGAEYDSEPEISAYPQPDPHLQLSILRELGQAIDSANCDFSVIMELVLEGIYRGVGMDRVIFALTTPDKQFINSKYMIGFTDENGKTKSLRCKRPEKSSNILFDALDTKQAHLVTLMERRRNPNLVPAELVAQIGNVAFMVAPILINQKGIGLFIADRGLSQRPLDTESFQNFQHFVQQANFGLSVARQRKS